LCSSPIPMADAGQGGLPRYFRGGCYIYSGKKLKKKGRIFQFLTFLHWYSTLPFGTVKLSAGYRAILLHFVILPEPNKVLWHSCTFQE